MNKGFTLLEVMIVLLIITLFGLVFSPKFISYDKEYFNPKTCQLKAMANKERCQFKNTIYYNQNGNINHAQTIKINQKTCIFQLGMGRYRCE